MVNKMEKKFILGIPRSLLFHTYGDMWRFFFDELNIDYIISPNSNKELLKRGSKLINDEACLSLKLHIGHVDYLKDKCDFIFIPRMGKLKKDEVVCTNFNALYDITRNIFEENKILHYNLDYKKNKTEYKEFIKIGRKLGKNSYISTKAYINAKKKYNSKKEFKTKRDKELFENNKKKILLIGHSYNVSDNLIGKEIITLLKKENISVITNPIVKDKKLYKKIMPTMYFSYHKELISSIVKYKEKVDGIIIISTFPCGTDSLVFDMLKKKIKDKPIINIIFDGFMSNTGLATRIESFIDIIKEQKNE